MLAPLAPLADWFQQIPAPFTVGVLVGLVLGIASRAALRLLAYAVGLVAIFELLHAAAVL